MKGEAEKIYYCKNNPNLIFVHRVFFFFLLAPFCHRQRHLSESSFENEENNRVCSNIWTKLLLH